MAPLRRWGWLAACWACGGAPAPAPAPYDPAVGLETFDAAWRIVRDTHFDTTFNGVDWVGLRDQLRPRAAAARDIETLRGVIDDMLGRLGQSHFSLIPRELADPLDPGAGDSVTAGAETGDLGLDVRLIDGELVVTAVEPRGPAASRGLSPGWVVTDLCGRPAAHLLDGVRLAERRLSPGLAAWSAAQARMAGPVGSACPLRVRDGAGVEHAVTLTRQAELGEPVKFGSLPVFFARFAGRRVPTPAGRTVGVLWFNFWMVPLVRQVDSVMDEFRALDGIVVDLRGNRGGVGAMIVGVAGHFTDRRDTLGTFQMRRDVLRLVANPRRVSRAGQRVAPYQGPVAVLIDEGSASASEVFAGGLQALGRVRVFGATSAGAVLPALWDRLPDGDVLYHAIAEFVTSAGRPLEGVGVVPDERVPLTRADLLAGRDPVLDAALVWIDRQ